MIAPPGLVQDHGDASSRRASGLSAIDDAIERAGVSAFNTSLIALLFAVLLLDGYDATVLSFTAPALIAEWNIESPAQLTPALVASLIGMTIGAPILGQLGDRLGRKPVLIVSCLIFGLSTGLVAYCDSIWQLTLLRFLGGVGIGGVAPNTVALMTEFAPRKHRALMVTVMFSGISVGSALPGVVGMVAPPSFGWRETFLLGGALPVLLGIVCIFVLPESIKYLLLRGKISKAKDVLQRVDPAAVWPDAVSAHREIVRNIPLGELFKKGRGPMSLALWSAFFCFFLSFYFLSTWTPILLSTLGIERFYATTAQTTFQVGGVVGGICLANLIDKRGPKPVVVLFIIAAPLVAVIGYVGAISVPWLLVVEFAAGVCVLGLSYGLIAMSGSLYPTGIRSTGSGWALGVGRIGSICGALFGGNMLGAGIDVRLMFAVVAVTLLIGAAAAWWLVNSIASAEKFELNKR